MERNLRLRGEINGVFLSLSIYFYLFLAPFLYAVTPEEQREIHEFLDAAFNAYVDKDYNKAMVNFLNVLRINPKDKVALRGIKQCRKKLREGQAVSAREERKNLRLAEKLLRQESWIESIDAVHGILSRVPNHAGALEMQNKIGISLKQKMLIEPLGTSNHLLYQGMAFYLRKEYDKAANAWREASALSPENMKLIVYIEKAEHLYRESARYEVLGTGRIRARSASDAGHYEEAAKLWKKILEFEPKDEEAQRELKRAQEILERKDRKDLIGKHYDKGLSLFQVGNFEESLKEWEAILAIDPDNEVAKNYFQRLSGRIRKSKKPETKKKVPAESKKSSNLYEKAESRYQQGLIAFTQGDTDKAEQEWSKALEIFPDHSGSKRALERLKQKRATTVQKEPKKDVAEPAAHKE